ncbi:MAG: hypothetical protein HY360_01895 [Verrucomicrobia bacterium]|nr:hypothetical protein [Verrucomicrobiota bacterium]
MKIFTPAMALLAATWVGTASANVAVPMDGPADGPTSLAIFDSNGVMVRTLWEGADKKASKERVEWDLLDDEGRPVKPGAYEYRIAGGKPVRPRYIATLANGRHPQVEGDLGNVEALNLMDVAVDAEGTIFSSGGGHGKAVQKISPDGKVGKAATIVSAVEVVSALALSDEHVFAMGDDGFYRIRKATMEHAPFPDGELVVRFEKAPVFYPPGDQWEKYEALRKEAEESRQSDGSSDPRTHAWRGVMRHPSWHYEADRIRGAAVWNGRLLISDSHHDEVLVYDPKTGKKLSAWTGIKQPSGIAVAGEKEIFVVSDRKVLALDAEGRILREVVAEKLERPNGLAIGPEGNLYVTDLGIPNRVKVFSPTGKLLRTFGREAPFNGKVTPDKLAIPRGIAVDREGNLILAEFGLNRIQKLTAEFKPVWNVQAFYCYLGTNDQADPQRIYGFEGPTFPTIREFLLDYKTGQWQLNRAWYLNKFDDASSIYGYLSQGGGVVAIKGQRFLYVYHKGMRIFRIDDDHLTPVARFGPRISFEKKDGTRADYFRGTAPQFSIWHDLNRDQRVTEDEVSILPDAEAKQRGLQAVSWDANITDDGTVYVGNMAFPLLGVENGIPRYGWDNVKAIPLALPDIRAIGVDDQGNRYYGTAQLDEQGKFPGLTFWAKRIGEQHITKYSPENKRLWQVGRKAYGRVQNGEFSYMTSLDWAGGFVFASDMDGFVNVYTEDGLFLTRMFRGTREGADPGKDPYCITAHELGQARTYRNPKDGKTYLVSQSLESGEHIRVYAIEGLDQVQRARGTFEVSAADLAAVKSRPPTTSKQATSGPQLIAISSVLEPPVVDGSLTTWSRLVTPVVMQTPDGSLSVKIMLRYDEKYLYLGAECVGDDTPAVNSYFPDNPADAWQSDCFNLFINTNPKADRSRIKPTAEDHQIFFPLNRAFARKPLRPYSFRKRAWIGEADYRITVKTGKGWTLTGKIPWSALGDYRPVPNDQIHLNFQVDFGNADGTASIFSLPWGGLEGSFANPSRWNGEGRIYYAR